MAKHHEERSEGTEEKAARRTLLPEINNAPPPPKDCGPNRCENCIYWMMRDARQTGKAKMKSCFERGYEAHDVCPAFLRKPDRLRHDQISHIQDLSASEIDFLYAILDDRHKQIAWTLKTAIRQIIKKAGGAVVYWRDEDGKKRAAKVERVTASSVMLKKNKAGVEKIRVTEVIEAISKKEYKARKSGKVTMLKEPGRKATI